MTIVIKDLDQIEAWESSGSAPIPVGKHIAEITAIEEKQASTGSPQLVVEWTVIRGQYVGTQSREWIVIVPKTYGKVKAFLLAVGWPLAGGEFTLPTTELIGRSAQIVVGVEMFNGKSNTRIVGHLPIDESDAPIDMPQADGTDLPF